MEKQKFTLLKSSCIPLPEENVDTDQIIPARFLKSIQSDGYGEMLFRDWRYNSEGNENPDFVLNNKTYSGSILIAGKNFGCGSSREHAAWALRDFGFKVVVSSHFADIFTNNCLNNMLLPVTVSESFLKTIFNSLNENHSGEVVVNLEEQSITSPNGEMENFQINAYKKECLLKGFDDIDYLISMQGDIAEYEKSDKMNHFIRS